MRIDENPISGCESEQRMFFPHNNIFSAHHEVAGGTDFIQKVVEAMHVPTIKAKIMLDLNAYDGFAALACVEDMVSLKHAPNVQYKSHTH